MKELELLTRAFSFICVIGLGYILKIQGIVRREDATIFSTLVMNVTLPASLFIASSTAQVSLSLYLPFLLGILCNLLLNLVDTGRLNTLDIKRQSGSCNYLDTI